MKKSWAVVSVAVVAITCLWFAVTSHPTAAPQQRTAPVPTPCDVPGVKGKARCTTFEVWENREARAGRRIALKVVVLPATDAPVEHDAITFFGGGPGQAATTLAPFLATVFAGTRQHRDILLVDQRGTGGSHALDCDLYPGSDPQTALGSFFPIDRVRACRSALEKDADLGQYTTANAVDDVDEVRGALGYDRLDLLGGSYGTRAALVFLRRHPDHARVAVLQGVSPVDEPVPRDFPRHAQRAIDRIFADCAADPSCHAVFPNPQADLRSIVERTIAAPVPVDILDPTTGAQVHVALSRNLLGEALRYLMYESSTALFVPDLVHQAANGDFAPLAEFALGSRKQLVNSLGQGLYLSVTCAEDLPFVERELAEREAASTFLGDYRYQQQRAACEAWVRGAVAPDSRQPVRSDTPVVMFSGAWDPATPPSNAERAAATLPRSLSVVIPAGGHDYQGLAGADACVGAITNGVVQRGTTDGVDISCVKAIRRPPFPTKPVDTKPVTLTAAQLDALAGRYVGTGVPPLEVRVDRGKLIGRLEGRGESLALAPVSPRRLRLLGDIGSYLNVEVRDGKATRVTLEQAGTTTFTWTRTGQ